MFTGVSSMPLIDLENQIKTYYNTDKDNVIKDFYKPCLENSKNYYRGVGYFRSSVFRLMNKELINFCLNGGKMTILTSTDIDPRDHKAAIEGYNLRAFYDTIEDMLDDINLNLPTKLLCAMVATGHLEIKIAVVPRGGIYHDKVGFFEDNEGNIVSFHGSGNETFNALVGEGGNIESYNVNWNWDKSYSKYGLNWEEGLKSAIEGKFKNDTKIINLSEIEPIILEKYEISLNLEDYFNQEIIEIEESLIPNLRVHQIEGIKKWKESNYRGILEHATGSGKTITAISTIGSHLKNNGNVILLVPSIALMEQWSNEMKKYLPNIIIGKIGGGNDDIGILNSMKRDFTNLVLISTISSAKKKSRLRDIKNVINKNNSSIHLIIDECHHIGSSGCEELCNDLKPDSILGLSATPERFGDRLGNERIKKILGEVVHKYTLSSALEDGHLTPYEYHIHTVNLTTDEQQEYDKLRKKINIIYHQWKEEKDNTKLRSQMEILTFKSRAIIRGAEQKIRKMVSLIQENYHSSHHWLIYCDTIEMLRIAEENIRSIGLEPKVYYSEMKDFQKQKTLETFERNGGLLLAIKCLDEGINIKEISHGMVLSSTTNPREFIQRRGRMLRKSEGKGIAHIYDTFALPKQGSDEKHIGFITSEILRAKDLALDSRNNIQNSEIINGIIRKYDIDDEHIIETEVIELD